MSVPFYVSPEQLNQDKAEFARKGVARGKPIVALDYEHGIVMIAENRSASLRKLGEVYDSIAFAGVGKFDEYENLRKQGVRYADLRGYGYSREDVSATGLATEYSSALGHYFSQMYGKPFEVELLLCEVRADGNDYFRIIFDGSVMNREHFACIGGDTERLEKLLAEGWKPGLPLDAAVRLGRSTLAGQSGTGSSKLVPEALEIVLLDRRRSGRKFRRLRPEDIRELE
jgi:proteasome alpha subunit